MKPKSAELYRLAIEIDAHYATRKEFVDAVNSNLSGKDKGINEQQVSNILHGRNGFGDKMKRRFAAAGIDIHYVETGVKSENDNEANEEKYNSKTNKTKVVGNKSAMLGEPVADLSFEGEIRIVRTSIEGGVRVQIYGLPSASYREVMRSAEPEFDADLPIPIPIATKQGVILKQEDKFALPELEDFGRAAATPKQPPSGRAFQEGQEP